MKEKESIISGNNICGNSAKGVMLRHSKHVGNGQPHLSFESLRMTALSGGIVIIFFCLSMPAQKTDTARADQKVKYGGLIINTKE